MDLGGGTGDLGTGVARALQAQVVIVDSTPQMLARVDAHPFVSVRLATAEELPFPDSQFDAVLCSDAFHHFRDSEAAVGEIRRTVRPGGGVVILEMDGSGMGRLLAVAERMLGEPAGFRGPLDLQNYLATRGIVGYQHAAAWHQLRVPRDRSRLNAEEDEPVRVAASHGTHRGGAPSTGQPTTVMLSIKRVSPNRTARATRHSPFTAVTGERSSFFTTST